MAGQQKESIFGGFGTLLGLPEGVTTPEQLTKRKQEQRLLAFRSQMEEASAGLPPEQRGVFNVFAQLGGALHDAVSKSDEEAVAPTGEEAQALAVINDSQQRIAKLRASNEFKSADPLMQGVMLKREMANTAAAHGDDDTFLQLMREAASEQLAIQKAKADIANIEADTTRKEAAADADVINAATEFAKLSQGEFVPMVPVVDGEPQPEAVMQVKQMPNGTFVNDAGEIVDPNSVMTLDAAKKIQDLRNKQAEATTKPSPGTVKSKQVVEFFKPMLGTKGIRDMTAQVNDTRALVKTTQLMGNLFKQTRNPADIIGATGTILNFGNELSQAFKGVGRNLVAFSEVDAEGKGVGKVFRPDSKEMLDKISDDWVPESIRGKAVLNRRWKAAIMEMVYAHARMNEPGARQLSDKDIENAMTALGVNSSDPEAVFRAFGDSVARRLSGLEFEFQNLKGVADRAELGNDALARLFGRDPLKVIEKANRDVFKVFRDVDEVIQQTTPGGVLTATVEETANPDFQPSEGAGGQSGSAPSFDDDELTNLLQGAKNRIGL